MGFFDTYEDTGGLNYIGAEEKATLIKNATPMSVLRAWPGEGQYGEKYTVVVDLDGEERALSFKKGVVESRDRMIEAMIEWLDEEGNEATEPVVLVKNKQSVLIRDASAVESS